MSGANWQTEIPARTRRDIRRAFGPDAVAMLQWQRDRIIELSARVDGLSVESQRLKVAAQHEERRLSTHLSRSRWNRLRWLLTGR